MRKVREKGVGKAMTRQAVKTFYKCLHTEPKSNVFIIALFFIYYCLFKMNNTENPCRSAYRKKV